MIFQIWRLLTATFLHDGQLAAAHRGEHAVSSGWSVSEMESFYGSRDFTVMYLSAAASSARSAGRWPTPSITTSLA